MRRESFKTIEDLNKFEDSCIFCLCGRLATGLHMNNCSKLIKERKRLEAKERGEK